MNAAIRLEILLREIAGLSPQIQAERLLEFTRQLGRTMDLFNVTLLIEHFRDHGSREATRMADVLAHELALRQSRAGLT